MLSAKILCLTGLFDSKNTSEPVEPKTQLQLISFHQYLSRSDVLYYKESIVIKFSTNILYHLKVNVSVSLVSELYLVPLASSFSLQVLLF